MQNYIFLDLETTGLDSKKDKIIEFSAIRVDEFLNETWRLDFICNPWIEVSRVVLNLTWIKLSEIEDSESFSFYSDQVRDFIQDEDIIVWHNIWFDISFLKESWIELNNLSIDTYILAWTFLPWYESYALEILTDVLDIDHEYKHRALWDVLACRDITKIIIWEILNSPKKFIEEIANIWFDWVYVSFIKNVASHSLTVWSERSWIVTWESRSALNEIKDGNQVEASKKSESSTWKIIDSIVTSSTSDRNVFFEWNTKERLIEKISEFFLGWNLKTVVLQDWYFQEINKLFRDKVNIIIAPELYTNNEKLENYLNEIWFNEKNQWVLLKILYAKHSWFPLSLPFINIMRDDFLIWNKHFALKNQEIEIKEKNLISFSNWKSNSEKFSSHSLLFIDPSLEDEDRQSVFWESVFVEKIEDKEDKNKANRIFAQIKDLIMKESEMTQYWIFYEVSQFVKTTENFIQIRQLLIELNSIIIGDENLKKQNVILDNFLNWTNNFNYINISSNLNLAIASLRINLLEWLNDHFNKSSFWFFSWSVMKYTDYLKKYYEIEYDNSIFEFENFPEVNISSTDINDPWWKHVNYQEFSFERLLELINNNRDKRICILSKSKKQNEDIIFFLNEKIEWLKVYCPWLSWGLWKVIHKANHESGGIVVIANNDFFVKYFLSEAKSFDLWVVLKLPFDNPWWVNNERTQKYSNSFSDYALPRSLIQVKQFVCASWIKDLFFMDNRVMKAGWADVYVKSLR